MFKGGFNTILSLSTMLLCLGLSMALENRQRQITAAENHYKKALALHNQEKFFPAAEEMDKVLRLAPDNAYYQAYKGLLLERGAEEKKPFLDALTRGEFSIKYYDLKKIRAAAKLYETALALSPNDGLFLHNLGWLYYFLKDYQGAADCFEKALSSRLRDPVYHVSLGLARERHGDFENAVKNYGMAVIQSPHILESEFFLDLKNRNQDIARKVVLEAAAKLEAAIQTNPDPIAKARLGGIYLQTAPDRSFILLNEALKALPNLSRTWSNLGRLYEQKEDKNSMKLCFEKAVFLDKADSFALAGLAKIYESENNAPAAMLYYNRAIAHEADIRSTQAKQLSVLYRNIRYMENDDVIPAGLLPYCRPKIDQFTFSADN